MVVNLDKLTYAGNLENLRDIESNPQYSFIKGDICDRPLVTQIITDHNIDTIVNFAAETHVDRSILSSAEFIQTNIGGVQALLDAAREVWGEGVGKRFLQISTDEVYGSIPEGQLSSETFPLSPNNPYSASKAAADLLVLSYYKTFKFPALITRSSNNYGPYQFPEKVIPLMILNALADKELPVYGDGLNIRDWIYVEDNCRMVDMVLHKGKIGEIYNIGAGNEVKNIDLVRTILKELGKSESLIHLVNDRPGHDRRYAMDFSKVKQDVGSLESVDFKEGIKQTIKWYRDNPAWWGDILRGSYKDYYAKVYSRR